MQSSRVILWIAITSFALVAHAALAQTGAVRVSVPFNFTVANQTLPAGDYLVTVDGSLLAVKALDGVKSVRVMTVNTGGNPNQNLTPRLIFHRYGERRFLAQVWIGEIDMGHQLFASAEEVGVARTTRQESVTLAAARPSK